MADLSFGRELQQLAGHEGPVALFLTHRRGAIVCVVDPGTVRSSCRAHARLSAERLQMLQSRLEDWCVQVRRGANAQSPIATHSVAQLQDSDFFLLLEIVSLIQACDKKFDSGDDSAFYTDGCPGLALAVARSHTAELLWQLYRDALQVAQISDRQIDRLVCSGGPAGSFTGLRIGASFVAGLCCGRSRVVYGVPTFNLPFLKSLIGSVPQGLVLEPARQGDEDPAALHLAWQVYENLANEYQLPIMGVEVLLAFCLTWSGPLQELKVTEMCYASEPGPVIALRSTERKI